MTREPGVTGGLLTGRRLLATGVLTEASLASAVVRLAVEQGADVLLTSPVCRGHRVTTRVAPRLGVTRDVLELDVTLPDDLAGLAAGVRAAGWDSVDGVLHAVAYLPQAPRNFTATPWADVAEVFQTAAWSLAALVHAVRPLLSSGAAVVGLELDPGRVQTGQGWLGVARGALEATARQLATELGPAGVRVNLVASGPHRTLLSKALPGSDELERDWSRRAPLGWDPADRTAVARTAVALLSDWLPATTGDVVHADGGAHVVG